MFWGKFDRHSVIHMPRWKRKFHLEQTQENLRLLYNPSGNVGTTETTEL